MKLLFKFILLISIFSGCITTDIQMEQDPVLRISESADILRVTESFIFESEYINSRAEISVVPSIWMSSNPSVVIVDDNGEAMAVGVGEAEISVSFGDLIDVTRVEVIASKEAISISNYQSIMEVGSSFDFSAVYLDVDGQATIPEDKIWKSSAPTILSVTAIADGKATVNALSVGSATITVTAGNTMNSVSVQTTAPPAVIPEEIRITSFTKSIEVGESFMFDAQFFNSSGISDESVDITWISSNLAVLEITDITEHVATVSARTVGAATITAQAGDITNSISVQSTAAPIVFPEEIRITNFVNSIDQGESFTFSATFFNSSGVPDGSVPIQWSSSDPNVIAVGSSTSGSTEITAVSLGSAMITAEANNVMSSVTVQVTAPPIMVPEEVRITNFTTSIEMSQNFMFEATYFDTSGLPDESIAISWSSSDNSVISITGDGVATAESVGNASIVAAVGAIQSTVLVEVLAPPVVERQVTLSGPAYQVSGTGLLKASGDDLLLELTDVVMGRSAPGPYLYLSNSSGNVNGGINLGKLVMGTNTINVTDIASETSLDQYDFLVIWCEPFGITLGFGEFDE